MYAVFSNTCKWRKSNWHNRKDSIFFLEKSSSPFLQPRIWILRSCDNLGVILNGLIQLLGFVFSFFFLLMLFCSLRTNCTAVSFFRKNQMQALKKKNFETYFNNRENPLGNLISWNFWIKLIWIHLYRYPSISPRSCIPRGILKGCSMSSVSHFCQTLKLPRAVLGFCYKLQCRCTGQQMLTNGLTLLHSVLGFFKGMQQADLQYQSVDWG